MHPDYIKTDEAVRLAQEMTGIRFTTVTIRTWINDFGIGMKIAGRWYVDRDRLKEVLQGKVQYENQGRPKKAD